MTPLDLARAWIAKGREDETLLRKILDIEEVSDDTFGYHVQQAIEKYLKAILAIDQVRPTKTHNLTKLISEVETTSREIPQDLQDLSGWTIYAVDSRYPSFDPTPILDRPQALALVETTRAWAEGLVEAQS